MSQNFATSVYGPAAGTTSTVSSASSAVDLSAFTRVAFYASAKAHIVFGGSNAAATTNDLPLVANTVVVYDIAPGRAWFSVVADTGSITLTWAPVS